MKAEAGVLGPRDPQAAPSGVVLLTKFQLEEANLFCKGFSGGRGCDLCVPDSVLTDLATWPQQHSGRLCGRRACLWVAWPHSSHTSGRLGVACCPSLGQRNCCVDCVGVFVAGGQKVPALPVFRVQFSVFWVMMLSRFKISGGWSQALSGARDGPPSAEGLARLRPCCLLSARLPASPTPEPPSSIGAQGRITMHPEDKQIHVISLNRVKPGSGDSQEEGSLPSGGSRRHVD